MFFFFRRLYLFQYKIYLIFRTVLNRAAKRRVPVTFLEKAGEYLSNIRTFIEKRNAPYTPCVIAVLSQPFHHRTAGKAVSPFGRLLTKADGFGEKQHFPIRQILGVIPARQKPCKHGMMGRIGKIARRLTFFP